MADVTLSELKEVRVQYDDLREGARPENSSGQCAYREYIFEEAVKFDIYQSHIRSDDEIIAFFDQIRKVEYTEMTEKDMFSFVTVALNVRDPVSGRPVMKEPWPEAMLCPTYKTAVPSTTNKVAMHTSIAAGTDTRTVPATEGTQNAAPAEESQTDQATAICFYFAWLTRFAVKMPSIALNKQYESVQKTYMKFYRKSSGIFAKFAPEREWLDCLRNAFDSFIRVKNTLVLHVASAETYYKTTPKVFNLLRYLFFQNLEFMGMHAYVSIVKIMSKVALPPALILTWLRISGAELAIDEAHTIMAKHDNGMISNGETSERLWKYARILDAGYFNRLQTQYSAELVSTLAFIEVKLGISVETGHNSPLNIHAISSNNHVKQLGRAKAEAFLECKNKVVSLGKDASVLDKIFAKNMGASVTTKGTAFAPMEVDPLVQKRPPPSDEYQVDEAGPSVKKTKSIPAGIPPPPFAF
ncbi:nucleoprotein [Sowthistle yellow vein virus]|uniref:Nucleoprotein n=1 Tax=Sowthistle yellow vein virus TaxID=2358214 RepID=A0AAE7AEW8_9RHAB|nr:nucleoprotein [Sowthistle yellow vein virus]QJQ80122.1 nucleoprotein [Sowthistle yellow vein virus]